MLLLPETMLPSQLPARLSQKILLNSSGLLNSGEPAGSVACSWSLLLVVDSPAGAGRPLLVAAVAGGGGRAHRAGRLDFLEEAPQWC